MTADTMQSNIDGAAEGLRGAGMLSVTGSHSYRKVGVLLWCYKV